MKKHSWRFGFISIVCGSIVATGWAADVTKGQALYASKCAMCHAKDLKGNPAIAKMKNLDLPALNLVKKETQLKKDNELADTITKGNGKMTAVKNLSADDVTNVIAYVRSIGGASSEKPK